MTQEEKEAKVKQVAEAIYIRMAAIGAYTRDKALDRAYGFAVWFVEHEDKAHVKAVQDMVFDEEGRTS